MLLYLVMALVSRCNFFSDVLAAQRGNENAIENGLICLGAICVSLHTMSKSSKGLFQNAVMLSGSALNPMVPRSRDHLSLIYNLGMHSHEFRFCALHFTYKHSFSVLVTEEEACLYLLSKMYFYRLIITNFINITAEHFHYTVDNNRDLIAFLRQIDANSLTKRTYQEFHYPGFGRLMANFIWSPIVERML